jgi:hypothetical protein
VNIALEVKKIADDGLNAMVKRVQSTLGVTYGDLAAQHFSGNKLRDQIVIGLMDYVIAEMQSQLETLEEQHDSGNN